jgi:hypothetical protein
MTFSALLQASLYATVSQHRNKDFHARRALELIVLYSVDFPHRVERRIRFTPQQFNSRFSRNIRGAICLIAHISRFTKCVGQILGVFAQVLIQFHQLAHLFPEGRAIPAFLDVIVLDLGLKLRDFDF